MMKRYLQFAAVLGLGFLLTGCYEDYVKDFDHSTIYTAYQYDLRTFVVGEGAKFDFTVGLAGVMANDRDRKVNVEISDALVTDALPAQLGLEEKYAAFTACDGMLAKGKFGAVSQAYVTNEVKALGISALRPLPAEYYTVEPTGSMCIRSGAHTDAVTVRATEAFLDDPLAIAPNYAIGFRILSADADECPAERSFEVIAVKYECKFYGYWYYGGEMKVVDNVTGKELSHSSYPLTIPQEDSKVYTLTTVGPYSVKTNKIAQRSGSIRLDFDGKDVKASSTDPAVTFGTCYTNDAPCIQDRVIYLNYSIDNGNGTTSVYTDELTFRNRIRDGISEWQDENPENYQ